MSPIDLLSQLSAHQSQIWSTVSMTVSESLEQPTSFSNALAVQTSTNEVAAELTGPMLVIQFSFSSEQDRPQVLLMKQEAFAEFAAIIKKKDLDQVEDVDDNLVADVRPQLESLVQGLCLAAGTLRDEPVVASGISIRHQIFQFPQNLQRADVLYRVQVAVQSGDFSGAAIWLMDGETAFYMVGKGADASGEEPFLQLQPGGTPAVVQGNGFEESGALGLLMDIPLEISVELGRVRMVVRDILELGNGSVIEIDKAAGEPVDVMVNGRLVARGEVVVIEDNFGVRITEICSVMDRLHRLGDAA